LAGGRQNTAFDALVDYCQMVIDSVEEAAEEGGNLERNLRAGREAKLLGLNHKNLGEDFMGWSSGWQDAVVNLGLSRRHRPRRHTRPFKDDELFKR
jgi:hypothetical protein